MAKRRMIHEAFFQSERVAALTMRQRLLVLGMISIADDQGRLRGNAFWIKARIFLYDAVTPDDIAGDLAAIAASNDTIKIYRADGCDYIQLMNWWDYQNLQWAKASERPAPEGWQDRIRQMVYKPKRWIMTLNWPGSEDCTSYSTEVLPDSLGNESGYELPNPLGIINTNTNTNVISSQESLRGQVPNEYADIIKG